MMSKTSLVARKSAVAERLTSCVTIAWRLLDLAAPAVLGDGDGLVERLFQQRGEILGSARPTSPDCRIGPWRNVYAGVACHSRPRSPPSFQAALVASILSAWSSKLRPLVEWRALPPVQFLPAADDRIDVNQGR